MSSDDEPEPAPEYPSDDHLSAYFREIGNQGLLNGDDELHMAKQLEQAEVDTWRALLATPATAALVEQLPETLRKKARLTRLVTLSAGRERQPYLNELRHAAKRIRTLDLDRIHVDAVLRERSIPPADLKNAQAQYRIATDLRTVFVTSNLRIVITMSKRYGKGSGLALSDLIQEGNLGLIHAVARFDYRRGLRFSTYACWWIRHALGRAIADKGREVRVPVHMQETNGKLDTVRNRLTGELGRPPTNEELSKASKVPLARINQEHHYLTGRAVSMNYPASTHESNEDTDHREVQDTIQDPNTEDYSPEETLTNDLLKKEVVECMKQLSPIEQSVLRLRFGFDGGDDELTLRVIGSKHGLSRERIRQIQKEAIAKLQRAMAMRHGGELER